MGRKSEAIKQRNEEENVEGEISTWVPLHLYVKQSKEAEKRRRDEKKKKGGGKREEGRRGEMRRRRGEWGEAFIVVRT